jgi:PAS domain-containing protein
MGHISRNAPCPCGSGKKYKKCCLPKDEENLRPPKTRHDYCLEVAESLRTKIIKFMEKGGHDRHIGDALEMFWQTLDPDLAPPEKMDNYDYLNFIDWFIHDYPIPDFDLPLIELYLESEPLLPAEEMQVLRDWQDAPLSVYQIRTVSPGEGFWAEDIFSGAEIFISDVRLSHQARKWGLITTRVTKVLDEWQCSGAARLEPPTAKEDILDFVKEGFRLIKKLEPHLELKDFLRVAGVALHQRFLTNQVQPKQLPKVLTSSGEELTFHEAAYDLTDLPQAAVRLESFEDFGENDREEDKNGQLLSISFSWLEKGWSARKAKKIRRRSGAHIPLPKSGPGQEGSRILGNVILEQDQLILEVQGEQRFALGKRRLETALAGLIQHRQDTARTLEEMWDDRPSDETMDDHESEISPKVNQAIIKDYLDEHYRQWLDTPLPALNGKSPRNAVKTSQGRRRVEDLLRELEYHHENIREYDISWIRKELGR